MSKEPHTLEFEGGDTREEAERRAALIKETMAKHGIKGEVTIEFVGDSEDNPGTAK